MKKLFTVLMTVAILCSISVPALAADSAEVSDYLWEDVAEVVAASGVEGRFVTFDEVALMFWLPDVYEDVLEDEDREEGYIGFFMTDDGEAMVSVTYTPTDYTEPESYLKDLVDMEIDAELVNCNGLDAVEYTFVDEEESALFWCLDFLTTGGNMVEMTIYPITEDEDTQLVTTVILSSIQPEDAEIAGK
ncbi:MAG: hypothetical protein K6C08_08800 [Oscillospiraceae bacterium]|nr:hypothetical protein [Oscillospiraceae bacterium]